MKNIFLVFIFILFGNVELFGINSVYCNETSKDAYLKEGSTVLLENFKKNTNADGTNKQEILEITDGNTHTYELFVDDISANYLLDVWDQASLRIKVHSYSKVSVKITEVKTASTVTIDNSYVHFRFLKPDYADEIAVDTDKNYGGVCYKKRLDQFDTSVGNLYSGTKDQDEFYAFVKSNNTVNILFEIDQALAKSKLLTPSANKYKFKATITITPIVPSPVASSNKLMVVNDQYNVKAPGAVNADGDFTGDTNLYTQLVGRSFDVQVISTIDQVNITEFHYAGLFSELDNGKIVPIDCTYLQRYMPKSPYSGCKMEMEDFDLYFKFANALTGMRGASPTNPKNYNLNFTIPVDRTDINYNKLFFEIQGYYNIANSNVKIRSNYFSARPAKLVLRTADLSKELFGGKKYEAFVDGNDMYTKVTAVDGSNNAAKSYNAKFISKGMILLDRSAKGTQNDKTWCSYDGSEDDDKKLQNVPMVTTAKFDEGVGKVYTDYEAANNKYYIKYPDIGHTKIYILDDTTTQIDQIFGDCINGSTSNDKVGGKIGCNVALEANYFKFKPSSFQITKKELKNGYIGDDGNITFFAFGKDYSMLVASNDPNTNPNYTDFMGGKFELDIQARLADDTVPSLYSKNCYANDININFELDKTEDEKKALENAKNNVSFYGIKDRTLGLDQNETYLIKIANLDASGAQENDGKFKLAKNSFYAGESNVSLKINFDREYNVAKDPIRIKSSDFKINGQDTIYTSVVINDKIIAVDDDRVVDYFYGRVYADDTDIKETENVDYDLNDMYYGVYCSDECQTKQGVNEEYEFVKDTINTTDDTTNTNYAGISGLDNYYRVKYFNKLSSDQFAKLASTPQNTGPNLEIYNDLGVSDEFGAINASQWKMKLKYSGTDPENIFTISMKTPYYMIFDKDYIGGEPKYSSFKVKFIRNSKTKWVGFGDEGDVMGIENENEQIKSKSRIDW
ncbi:hypothetical protein [Campylobacter fetus]|uniref:hypothetical protein n=1 Tax=Campylobacter fetus TaxID=196 RepID=UPI000FC9AF15|nr:hypothetical protein [Campylobacter fetus]RUT51016.1 hypothetical protein BWK67_00395 [Campylobacter fetus]RUT51744.1 hypothetical protein BWK51_00395 [Campylobacter fetus]